MIITSLTTIDNPYHPIEQFDKWFQYDVELGYNTLAYVARIAGFSSTLTDEENNELQTIAVNEIIDLDPFYIYLKVETVVEDEETVVM